MILELRKSCLDAIQRALTNITHIRNQWHSIFPKPAQQKLHSVQNDIQLLRDNFTLIVTKVVRLQSKCNQKETFAHKVQLKYRHKYEQISQAYKILEVKYQKMGKQLNFIKFSNNTLRKEIQTLENKQLSNNKLKNGIKEIQELVLSNSQNLQIKINKIITNIQQECQENEIFFEPEFQIKIYNQNYQGEKDIQDRMQSIQEFSIQKPPIKIQIPNKEQRKIINSCELKSEREHLKTKKKPQPTKQSSECKQSVSTDKKKRNQLARLVQQQGRLARINERYLSTDLF